MLSPCRGAIVGAAWRPPTARPHAYRATWLACVLALGPPLTATASGPIELRFNQSLAMENVELQKMLKASANDTNQTTPGSPTSADHFDTALKNRTSHSDSFSSDNASDTTVGVTRCGGRRKCSEIACGDCQQAAAEDMEEEEEDEEEEEEAAAEAAAAPNAEHGHGHGHGHASKSITTKAVPAVVPTPPSPTKPLREFKFAVPAPRAAAIKRPSLVTGTL